MPITKKRVRVTDPPSDQKSCSQKCCTCCYSNLLFIFILLAIATGVGLGLFLRFFVTAFKEPKQHQRELVYLYFPVELLIRLVNFLTLPLLVSSLISGIGNITGKATTKIGLRVLVYYMGITFIAVGEGLACAYAVQPGDGNDAKQNNTSSEILETYITQDNRVDLLLDTLKNLIPDNCLVIHNEAISARRNISASVVHFKDYSLETINILGLAVFSVIFGVAISVAGGKGRLLFCVFDAVFETIMKIMKVVMWFYPVGIIILTATSVIEVEDPVLLLEKMFVFILTVFVGLFTHVFLVLPVIFLILARKNPYKHLLCCLKVLFTAFATNNSNMAFPVAVDCLETTGYDPRIVRFVTPVGTTINSSGFALYGAVSVIFLTMLNDISLGPGQIIVWGVTLVALSIFIPTGSGSGIVPVLIFFKIIGLPMEDMGLLVSVDWILARLCTTTCLWGDCIGVGIVEHRSHSQLQQPEVQDCVSHSSGEELDEDEPPVLTKFSRLGTKDWTVQLINESGDHLFVSKV